MAWGNEPWTPRSAQEQELKSMFTPLARATAKDTTKTTNANTNQCNTTRTNGLRLSLANTNLCELNMSPSLRCRLIALNLSNNQFTEQTVHAFTNVVMSQLVRSADLALSCMPLYLREIKLNNNNLTIVPDLGEVCHTLLSLDLSNSLQMNIDHPDSEENLRKLTRLRSLALESCNITNVCRCEPGERNEQQTTPLRCCFSSLVLTLEHLNLSCNNVSNFEEINSLACLKRLVTLDVFKNPVEQTKEYSERARKFCLKLSTLKQFNGCGYKHGMQTAQFTDMITSQATGLSAGQAGDDSASCSCLEGNPCMVAYNCKHWARRYEVAKINGWKGF